MQEHFFIDGHSGRLSSVLDLPENIPSGGIPLVVYCHGLMDTKEGVVGKALSKSVPEGGMALLRFDFNGHGESEGPTFGMTIPSEIDDAVSVLSFVRGFPWVKSVSLCGHSLGGVVASMVAGKVGYPEISALLLYAPAGMAKEDAWRGYVVGGSFDPENVPEKIPLLGNFILGREYIMTARQLPIYETAALYKGPTCIIHGKRDVIVPPSVGENFHKVIEGSEMMLLDGARHDFASCRENAAEVGAQWLRSKLF